MVARVRPKLRPGETFPLQPSALRTRKKPAPAKPKPGVATVETRSRFRMLNDFVDGRLDGLTRAEVKVWLVLYRDTRNGSARTAQEDIARRSGLTARSVRTAIRKLEKGGLLVVKYRGGLNTGVSIYQVKV